MLLFIVYIIKESLASHVLESILHRDEGGKETCLSCDLSFSFVQFLMHRSPMTLLWCEPVCKEKKDDARTFYPWPAGKGDSRFLPDWELSPSIWDAIILYCLWNRHLLLFLILAGPRVLRQGSWYLQKVWTALSQVGGRCPVPLCSCQPLLCQGLQGLRALAVLMLLVEESFWWYV